MLAVIRYVSFVDRRSCVPISDVYTDEVYIYRLEVYTHTMSYIRERPTSVSDRSSPVGSQVQL